MTHEERIRFAEILKQPDGTMIELKNKNGHWFSAKIENVFFVKNSEGYRLKPNYPREIWVNVYEDAGLHAHQERAAAERQIGMRSVARAVKYVLAE